MCNDLSGPDFLSKLADVERGNGFDINASEYDRRSREWQELENRADAADREVARLSTELLTLRNRAERAAAELTTAH